MDYITILLLIGMFLSPIPHIMLDLKVNTKYINLIIIPICILFIVVIVCMIANWNDPVSQTYLRCY